MKQNCLLYTSVIMEKFVSPWYDIRGLSVGRVEHQVSLSIIIMQNRKQFSVVVTVYSRRDFRSPPTPSSSPPPEAYLFRENLAFLNLIKRVEGTALTQPA